MNSAVALPARAPSWRALVLPREHGSWSLALEPLALALLVAPSGAGFALAGAGVALFLARRPWHVARAGDARRSRAGVLLTLLVALAAASLGYALLASPVAVSHVLLLTLPAGAVFAWFDQRRAGREVTAEVAGALVFAGAAAAIVLAAGHAWPLGAAVGGFAATRSVTSILAIRTFLRRRKGETGGGLVAIAVPVLAAAAFVVHGSATGAWLPAVWSAVFVARAVWLLGPRAPDWTARRLGMTEAVLGLAVVVSTGLAWR